MSRILNACGLESVVDLDSADRLRYNAANEHTQEPPDDEDDDCQHEVG